jgi:hypothetical protein
LELEQQPPPQQQNVQVQPPLVSAAATGLAPEQMAKLRSELDMVNVRMQNKQKKG